MSDITNSDATAPVEAASTDTPVETPAKKPLMSEKTKALLGSWTRVFVAALIAAVLGSGQAPWTWDGTEAMNFVWSAVSATLLVIYNYLNPKDVRYGVGSDGEQASQE